MMNVHVVIVHLKEQQIHYVVGMILVKVQLFGNVVQTKH
jgi:hypothetical protein